MRASARGPIRPPLMDDSIDAHNGNPWFSIHITEIIIFLHNHRNGIIVSAARGVGNNLAGHPKPKLTFTRANRFTGAAHEDLRCAR